MSLRASWRLMTSDIFLNDETSHYVAEFNQQHIHLTFAAETPVLPSELVSASP